MPSLINRITAIFILFSSTARAGLLDGTAWEISLVPTRQTAARGVKAFEDVLSFARGTARSGQLREVGSLRYTASGGNGFFNWKTKAVLREKNRAEWSGVINGGNIDGNLKWVTREGTVRFYTLSGRKR